MTHKHTMQLSKRELDVLQLLWDGIAIKEIPKYLGISYGTVRKVRVSIGQKLHVHDTWQLARRALDLGLIEL